MPRNKNTRTKSHDYLRAERDEARARLEVIEWQRDASVSQAVALRRRCNQLRRRMEEKSRREGQRIGTTFESILQLFGSDRPTCTAVPTAPTSLALYLSDMDHHCVSVPDAASARLHGFTSSQAVQVLPTNLVCLQEVLSMTPTRQPPQCKCCLL